MKTGIIVFAHGSSVESANNAVRAVTARVAELGSIPVMDTAFLEMARPDLPEAVDRMAAAGVERIVVVPYFLTLGIHLKRDLPRIVGESALKHPGLTIDVTEPLDGHPALAGIVLERAQKAIGNASPPNPTPSQTI